MNLGIEDGVAAGECLSRVLRGESDELLDTYAAQRRQVADRVVQLADRLTTLATMSARRRPIRNTAMRLAGMLPAVRRRLAVRLSGLDRRAGAGTFVSADLTANGVAAQPIMYRRARRGAGTGR